MPAMSVRPDALWRDLCRYDQQPQQLWRMRHRVPKRSDLLEWEVLSKRPDQLCRHVREHHNERK